MVRGDLRVEIGWENPQYAFIKAPGVSIGFHPADAKCPGGIGGTTVYWEVESIEAAVRFLTERGAQSTEVPAPHVLELAWPCSLTRSAAPSA